MSAVFDNDALCILFCVFRTGFITKFNYVCISGVLTHALYGFSGLSDGECNNPQVVVFISVLIGASGSACGAIMCARLAA